MKIFKQNKYSKTIYTWHHKISYKISYLGFKPKKHPISNNKYNPSHPFYPKSKAQKYTTWSKDTNRKKKEFMYKKRIKLQSKLYINS